MRFTMQRVPRTSKSDLGHITPYFDYALRHISDEGEETTLVVVYGLDPVFQAPKGSSRLAREVFSVVSRFEKAFDTEVETLGFTMHSTTKQERDFA